MPKKPKKLPTTAKLRKMKTKDMVDLVASATRDAADLFSHGEYDNTIAVHNRMSDIIHQWLSFPRSSRDYNNAARIVYRSFNPLIVLLNAATKEKADAADDSMFKDILEGAVGPTIPLVQDSIQDFQDKLRVIEAEENARVIEGVRDIVENTRVLAQKKRFETEVRYETIYAEVRADAQARLKQALLAYFTPAREDELYRSLTTSTTTVKGSVKVNTDIVFSKEFYADSYGLGLPHHEQHLGSVATGVPHLTCEVVAVPEEAAFGNSGYRFVLTYHFTIHVQPMPKKAA